MSRVIGPPEDLWPKSVYFVWQASMYGTGKIDLDAPAELMRWRPMPCTPSGDLVSAHATGEEAIDRARELMKKEE